MRFEWDDEKAAANIRKHGVSFEEAARVFADPRAIEIIDEEQSIGERRFAMIGLADAGLLYVVFTERAEAIRIIHARKADRKMERFYEKGQIAGTS
jgi:uncharacterized DUF497 family protein